MIKEIVTILASLILMAMPVFILYFLWDFTIFESLVVSGIFLLVVREVAKVNK